LPSISTFENLEVNHHWTVVADITARHFARKHTVTGRDEDKIDGMSRQKRGKGPTPSTLRIELIGVLPEIAE
jgi:hypothetical protein